ncbi:MAG: ATP-binding SpoIIE family protein phosphatase [Vicinamibacteria bacterium]
MTTSGWPPPPTEAVTLADASQVGEARRLVAGMCARLQLDETTTGQASLVATEAANNVLRHGGGGELLVRPLAPAPGLELLAIDRGPGIADLSRAMEDGYSTIGTSGTGLGAMRRLSSTFDVYTRPQQGTAVLMRVGAEAPVPALGAVTRPYPGETECGDVWDVETRPFGVRLLIADGLGHGPQARESALLAARGATRGVESPQRGLEEAHAAARAGRGAAMAVADVDLQAREIRYAGVGNISAMILDPHGASKSLVSMNGTIGQGAVRVRPFVYPFEHGSLLVMFSDGLATHWSFEAQPGLLARHPSLLASVLYREHWRRRDDVTVLALRLAAP